MFQLFQSEMQKKNLFDVNKTMACFFDQTKGNSSTALVLREFLKVSKMWIFKSIADIKKIIDQFHFKPSSYNILIL